MATAFFKCVNWIAWMGWDFVHKWDKIKIKNYIVVGMQCTMQATPAPIQFVTESASDNKIVSDIWYFPIGISYSPILSFY